MLSFPHSPQVQILVGREPVEMRKSFDGLSGIVIDAVDHDAQSGHLGVRPDVVLPDDLTGLRRTLRDTRYHHTQAPRRGGVRPTSGATPVHALHREINAEDALTSLVRRGAIETLAAALEAVIDGHIDRCRDVLDEVGRRRVAPNGGLPEREIRTGAGELRVKQPRARVHGQIAVGPAPRLQSKLIPPSLRKAKNIEVPIPCEYLRGVSTDNKECALVPRQAPPAHLG
ncbi:MAG: hypothetical protein ACPGPE_11020 [Planctomycetota bacterium]